MVVLTNRKINSSLIHTESLEIINTIFEITLYDNSRRINAIFIIDARHMIPQRFISILMAKIWCKRLLSFFSNEIVKKDCILHLIYNKGKIMIFTCS